MYYHVSMDTSRIVEEFTPRIPNEQSRIAGEDRNIARICVARSIEDCLTGFPEGGYQLQGSLPVLIRVYEFDAETIAPENVVRAPELFLKQLVPDAWVTGENWVLNQSIKPSRSYLIEIKEVVIVDAPYITIEMLEDALEEGESIGELMLNLDKRSSATVARVESLRYKRLPS
ncbi:MULTISPECIES: hypothetical protein [unclassified Exiguobacterium]|uniref:hypothetical protein n=1 Tax=unclassified Exiguobacterium TaxID=2644629 RepID=UPI001BE7BD0A|nr:MULTISPECIES: hypothetical protein [unclassified Exiguobacterium]